MKNKIKSYLSNNRGLTLVEVLTAGTLLMILVFCFAPLFATYSNTVSIAGENLSEVQNKAGIMESLLGIDAANGTISGNYKYNVSEIALKMSSNKTSISLENDEGKTGNLTASNNGLGMVQLTDNSTADYTGIGSIAGGGSLLATTDGVNSYATINAKGSTATLSYFPKSLTDDFKEATIVLVGDGVTFSSTYATDVELYVTSRTPANKITKDSDYKISKPGGTDNIIVLTIYGGGRVSFETSPLIVYYEGAEYKIEVDAPTMIMVGEADTGKARATDYHYYVSRGETEKETSGVTSLIVLQRSMNSIDTGNGNGTVSLSSAMNDVEWVSAEDADKYAVDGNGDKYGYYIMCGDEGQIRRFWKDSTTGNYYWGGDYTDYTDIKLDSVDKLSNYKVVNTYATEVSYKYSSRNSHNGGGFELGGVSDNKIEAVNIASANAATNLYLPIGRAYFLHNGNYSGTAPTSWPDLNTIQTFAEANPFDTETDVLFSYGGVNYYHDGRHAYYNTVNNWSAISDDSYYKATGLDAGTNLITLTSCGIISITPGQTASEGGAYQTDVKYANSDIKNRGGSGVSSALEGKSYPTETYSLYCGYIPATMDLWQEKSSQGSSTSDIFKNMIWSDEKNHYVKTTVDTLGAEASMDSARWKANLGVTPYGDTSYNTDGTVLVTSGEARYEVVHDIGEDCDYEKTQVDYIIVYPYKKVNYAVTGKFYDSLTPTNAVGVTAHPNSMYGVTFNRTASLIQQYMTAGNVVDITLQYLSNPFAVHVAANPSEDTAYDYHNNKQAGAKILNWSSSREVTTFLDVASTKVPSGNNDVEVSLLVGYTTSGMYDVNTNSGSDFHNEINATSIMNNGIVYIRSGTAEYKTGSNDNNKSTEYFTVDNTGYYLNTESNTFHQFYYLNTRTNTEDNALVGLWSGNKGDALGFTSTEPKAGDHIGNLFGARCWQNNRHIQNISMGTSGTPGTGYNYLRSHPLHNTQVTCVAWGVTWNNNPEAMWGTENGTVLSWYLDVLEANNDADNAKNYNDRTITAEFQSYKWVDRVNTKNGATGILLNTKLWGDTVGSADEDVRDSAYSGTTVQQQNFDARQINDNSEPFVAFMDKTTQILSGINANGDIPSGDYTYPNTIGFISTLESINDIEFANDYWVAVGDQSDVNPDAYCGSAAYSHGGSGSWVNVRYWNDIENTGKKDDGGVAIGEDGYNAYYCWKAVRITDVQNCNIVQINYVNGIWIATGYKDGTNGGTLNDEYDAGEEVAIFWTRDPLSGWSSAVNFYANAGDGKGYVEIGKGSVGGINSCATRSE